MNAAAAVEDDEGDEWEHINLLLEAVERRASSNAQAAGLGAPSSDDDAVGGAQKRVQAVHAAAAFKSACTEARPRLAADNAAAGAKRPPGLSPSALRHQQHRSNIGAFAALADQVGGGAPRATVVPSVNAAVYQQQQQQQQQQQPQQQQQQQQQQHKRRIPFSVLLQGPPPPLAAAAAGAELKPPSKPAARHHSGNAVINGNSSSSSSSSSTTAAAGTATTRNSAAGGGGAPIPPCPLPNAPPRPPPPPPASAATAGVGQLAAAAAAWEASLPAARYEGRTVYARTAAAVEAACGALLKSGARAVGFDIEWRTNFKKGQTNGKAALVQLCYFVQGGTDAAPPPDGRGCVALLLHVFHSGLTPALREVLRREDVALLGVNVGGDAGKLRSDYAVHVAGCVDVGDVANGRVLARIPGVARCIAGPRRWSLAALSAEALRVRVPKPNHVRMGNWEAAPLPRDFCDYAALDAFLGLRLHWALSALPLQVTASDVHMQRLRARAAALGSSSSGGSSDGGGGGSDGSGGGQQSGLAGGSNSGKTTALAS